MDPAVFFGIIIVAFLVWLIGHSFIESFFDHKEEIIERMLDNDEKGEE